jgi:hypothetical protein
LISKSASILPRFPALITANFEAQALKRAGTIRLLYAKRHIIYPNVVVEMVQMAQMLRFGFCHADDESARL